ncbi:MAG: hypothetical protein HY908_06470 [Myxococcales bacterium]|nr:hypothetical protein [Myxococcales bacterium]
MASTQRARVHLLLLGTALALVGCRDELRAGDACAPAERGHMRCQNATTALACQQGTWQQVPCHGPQGCSGSGYAGVCDDGVAVLGEPCVQAASRPAGEDHACSSDGRSTLVCLTGRWEAARACRGEKGCTHEGAVVRCDQTRAEAGDACNDSQSAFGACSVDGTTMLRCDAARSKTAARPVGRANGVFRPERPCAPKTGCRIGHVGTIPDRPAVLCDLPDARAGAPCPPRSDDAPMCTEDGSAILRCHPSRLILSVEQTCLDGTRCQPVEPGSNLVRCGR